MLARYINGRIAALVRPVGVGRVAVTGPHPEATRSWYRWDGLVGQDHDGADRRLGFELIDEVMQ